MACAKIIGAQYSVGAMGDAEKSEADKRYELIEQATGALTEGFVKGDGKDEAKQTPQQLGFGLAILTAVFMLGWLDGLSQSKDICETPGACDPFSIIFWMALAMLKMWFVVLLVTMVVYCIDVVIVGVIIKPIHGDGSVIDDALNTVIGLAKGENHMVGMKVLRSWLFSSNVLLAVLASLAMTGGFSVVYVTWLKLRDAGPDEYAKAVYNIYIFQLIAFIAMIVCEFWLLEWWKR